MGESKRRGTRTERVAEALGLEKHNLDDFKKEHGLPADAEFCGYLIHIEKSDEFLASIEDTPSATKRIFAKTPELAMRFKEFGEANDLARAEKNEIVAGMFDFGTQLFVFPIL